MGKYGVESDYVEFKSSHLCGKIEIALCAMLNSIEETTNSSNARYRIYVGVDNNGNPINDASKGIYAAKGDFKCKDLDQYAIRLKQYLGNKFVDNESINSLYEIVQEKDAMVVRILIFRRPKDIVVLKDDQVAYARNGAESKKMSEDEIEQRRNRLLTIEKDEQQNIEIKKREKNVDSAIKNKKRIRLFDYESSNTNTKKNRDLEPYNRDNLLIRCYEIETQRNKTFRLDRCSHLQVLTESCEFEERYEKINHDVFGFSSYEQYHVVISMQIIAKNEIIQRYKEYGIEKCIQENNGTYILDCVVCNLMPIQRFCIAWFDCVKIVEGDELMKNISSFIKKYLKIDNF